MITKNWKQSRRPSTGESINELWFIIIVNTTQHKKEQSMVTYTTWMNFKSIMLNEGSQSQNAAHCKITLLRQSQKDKMILTETRQ